MRGRAWAAVAGGTQGRGLRLAGRGTAGPGGRLDAWKAGAAQHRKEHGLGGWRAGECEGRNREEPQGGGGDVTPSQIRGGKFRGAPWILCGAPNVYRTCVPLVCEKFVENPESRVGNFAVNLKREISHAKLKCHQIPPPPTLSPPGDVRCAGHRGASTRQHNKILVGGTIGALRLRSDERPNQLPPPPRASSNPPPPSE